MYREELKRMLLKGLLGFVIGVAIAASMGPESGKAVGCLMLGLYFAGLPYGWQLSGKVIGGWVVGSVPIMATALVVRILISLLVGCFAYPIALVYYIIQARKEARV